MRNEKGSTRAPNGRRAEASLVGRGSGITHSFEQSRLLRGTPGSLVLRTAEPLGVLPAARNGSAAQPDLAMSIRTRSIALRTSHGRSGASPHQGGVCVDSSLTPRAAGS